MQRNQPNSKLSSSAQSYLQSLEQSTKAMQQSLAEKRSTLTRKESDGGGSLLSMIGQMRRSQSKNDYSDEDDSIEQSPSFLKNSLSDLSEESGEKVVFDLPGEFDLNSSLASSNHFLPNPIPEKTSKKSILEMRELRNSIDQSLIKPPKLEKRTSGLNVLKEDEKDREEEGQKVMEKISEEQERPQTVKKSVFKRAIESGSSDAESIDFEEISSGSSNSSIRFEENKDNSSASFSSSTSNTGTSQMSSFNSSQSNESSPRSSSSSTVKKSSSSRASSRSKKTSKSSSRRNSQIVNAILAAHESQEYSDDFEDEEEKSSRERARKGIVSQKERKEETIVRHPVENLTTKILTIENKRKKKGKEKKRTKARSSSEIRVPKSLEDNPQDLSLTLHLLVKEVMDTHLALLRSYHEMEWQTTNRWRQQLEEMKREYDGRRMRELENIMQGMFRSDIHN